MMVTSNVCNDRGCMTTASHHLVSYPACATLKALLLMQGMRVYKLTNIIKELSSTDKFHDHEDMGRSGDHLIQLDDMRMTK